MAHVRFTESQKFEMGNSGTTEEEPKAQTSTTGSKKQVRSLRVSTDWRQKGDDSEAPEQLTVDHLLRYTEQKIEYTSSPPSITVGVFEASFSVLKQSY